MSPFDSDRYDLHNFHMYSEMYFKTDEKLRLILFRFTRKRITFAIIKLFCNCQLLQNYIHTGYKPNFYLYEKLLEKIDCLSLK